MHRSPTPHVFMNPLSKSFRRYFALAVVCTAVLGLSTSFSDEPVAEAEHTSLSRRFAQSSDTQLPPSAPDFQRHIGPLLGRLGCNGRSCHGSFQGRGGFQLSLFGYDFHADHKALLAEGTGRVDVDAVDESLILAKPIDADMHEGGKRMDIDSWQYRALQSWVASGAEFSGNLQILEKLVVTPSEIIFRGEDTPVQLRAIAHWADGTTEDVTELCRFTTNDDAVSTVNEDGLVSTSGAGDTHIVIAYDKAVVPVTVIRPMNVQVAMLDRPAPSSHPIDQLVQIKLEKLQIVPSELCSDADFIRRASLDTTGILPSPDRVKRFLDDPSPDKRARLVDELLDEDGYAAWWATRLSDWTGNNEAQLNNYFPVRGAASKFWYAWLEKRLADNVPYDDIVEGIVMSESRHPDESYSDYCEAMSEACREGDKEAFAARPGIPLFWARNNFRAPEERAIGFAYTFLGIRIQCAQCHKHPFDRWSKEDFDKFAVLFSSVQANQNLVSRDARETRDEMMAELVGNKDLRGGDLRRKIAEAFQDGEVVPFPELVIQLRGGERMKQEKNPKKKKQQQAKQNVPTGNILGDLDQVSLASDPREALMQWLREPNNPYFAKAIVNRVWANYFGIGIVNPTDDMNLGNPPSNGPLLDFLASEFVESGYDLKRLHRLILLSDTYQRSSKPNGTNAADQRNFSRHVPRRLPAEVIRDAVFLATASDDEAEQARRELSTLAIGGLSNIARGNVREFSLQVFGTSARESNCDCDRSETPNVLQAIYLQNDMDIHRRLTRSGGWASQASVRLTGSRLKERGGQAGGDNQARAIRNLNEQIERRLAAFKDLPPKRQAMMKPQVEKQLRAANKKLEQLGAPKISLNDAFNAKPKANETIDDTPQVTKLADKSKQEIPGLIENAYLRTLTRLPDEEEMQIATQFIEEASHAGEAIESLMWTLLNTKEFILSH